MQKGLDLQYLCKKELNVRLSPAVLSRPIQIPTYSSASGPSPISTSTCVGALRGLALSSLDGLMPVRTA